MLFPAHIVSHDYGWMVSFPDIPESVTLGRTRETALAKAKDDLQSALQDYFAARREVPEPSQRGRNQEVVELPTRAAAKVLLLNEMVRQGVRPIELARRLGTTSQEASRIIHLRHATKIDRIGDALNVLGKRLALNAV